MPSSACFNASGPACHTRRISLLACLLFTHSNGAFLHDVVTLPAISSSRWHYVGRFGFAIGAGKVAIRARIVDSGVELPRNVSLTLAWYLDEHWKGAQAIKDGCLGSPPRKTALVELGDLGQWTEREPLNCRQFIRPHFWYFAVSDCNGAMGPRELKVEIELHMYQEDLSELSYEKRMLMRSCSFILAPFGTFLLYVVWDACKARSKAGMLHPVLRWLVITMGLLFVSQAAHVLHLLAYSDDGVGLPRVEVTAEVVLVLSQISTASLLILIAHGYTLTQMRVHDLGLAAMICGSLVTFAHVVLAVAQKCRKDDGVNHHEHEGWLGFAMFAMRLLLLLWFASATCDSYAAGGLQMQQFFRGYGIAGSLHFLGYPVLYLVVRLWAEYLRAFIMNTGLLLVQAVSYAWLVLLFSRTSDFYRLSTLSDACLPIGGVRRGYAPDAGRMSEEIFRNTSTTSGALRRTSRYSAGHSSCSTAT